MRKAARLVVLSVFLFGHRNSADFMAGYSFMDRADAESQTSGSPIPTWTYEVVKTYPHDPAAYTQGLIYCDGALFESTGLHGQSSLRRVELATGKVLKIAAVSPEYFAEGLTIFKSRLFQLTWVNKKGFIYEPDSFRVAGEFAYEGEGWGLTSDGRRLIMGDGTSEIRFINPVSFKTERKITVTINGRSVPQINELEYIKGEIFANVWQTDYILRIDPKTGRVVGLIDMAGLLSEKTADPANDVLNGIAYDEKKDRIFVTGKRWPKLFEVRFKEKKR